jgi:hypothetical protein
MSPFVQNITTTPQQGDVIQEFMLLSSDNHATSKQQQSLRTPCNTQHTTQYLDLAGCHVSHTGTTVTEAAGPDILIHKNLVPDLTSV